MREAEAPLIRLSITLILDPPQTVVNRQPRWAKPEPKPLPTNTKTIENQSLPRKTTTTTLAHPVNTHRRVHTIILSIATHFS